MTAHRQWGMDLDAALGHEAVEGARPLREDARAGASRFASVLGRSGDFGDI